MLRQFELGRHVENEAKPFDPEALPFLLRCLSEGED
jgi:hypothetical protein